jgi:predicted CXXCH cytochrome family protein
MSEKQVNQKRKVSGENSQQGGGSRMRKLTKLTMLTVAAIALLGAPAMSFHDGGVADCAGCHTMHNSQDGVPVDADGQNPWLLVDDNPSDVCLGCHATGLGAVWGDDMLAPPPEKGGGNFTFLDEDNLNDGHAGGANPIAGDAAGHNVIAQNWGPGADSTLTMSPGGNFPAGSLGCTSCHDPHGTDQFRLLYGSGRLVQDFYTFTEDAPTAEGLSLFFGAESNSSHTAYQGGMSAWCSNCHTDYHDASGTLRHPSGEVMGGSIANTYNIYNGTVDQLGGVQATAYLADVPFEDAAATTSSTAGPSFSSEVSCITCHRAHATSAPDSGRWDFAVAFLHEDGLESGSYAISDPYADLNQRSLCNKCHNQDEYDRNPF